MTTEHRGPELVRDDELTTELRALYAAPTDAGYWRLLEQRIMARLDASAVTDAWWSVPEKWMRVGMLAAGFAVIVAASLLLRTQTQYARAEYETVIDPATIDAPTLAARERLAEQATYRALTGR